jgi:hypothetical protein
VVAGAHAAAANTPMVSDNFFNVMIDSSW